MSSRPPPQVRKLDDAPTAPEEYYLPVDRLIVGNPKQTVWMQYQDASGRFCAGIWASEVGKWKVRYTEEEYCRLLEGRCVITDSEGRTLTFDAGDSFVMPRDFAGTWEVVAPARKVFVVYEPGTSDPDARADG